MSAIPPAIAHLRSVLDACHQGDVRFFRRRADRQHRVRLAGSSELALARYVAGITDPVPAGIRAFVGVKRVPDGRLHRVIGFWPEGSEVDLPEQAAAAAYLDFLEHDNAKLRTLAEGSGASRRR
ncbi:hypothetical protein [Methylobacterium ajmalii]|jgi:hypothetical protein|uniref:hypothetical protein n=1 Tax=Methylobacterium ajmalii TaxID=2738439 RepID=UPI00190D9CB5|nr:hypothetical protein [Methylobacterium ajmalii]MBK3400829.1 hypothetical protein [Methylobacterium ajmalii]MBK3412271.1 hypothetical protein [Methylobacterium ajmalii]MBK3426888.1 hypothetical protein [Methylobacterium ajmalii]MBZ6416927.1 hypothetical protein [Methylobacterium sp.]